MSAALPNAYTPTFFPVEAYDQMLVSWLTSAPIQTGNRPLVVVVATPDRAFSQAWQLLTETTEEPPPGALRRLPLPICSLSLSAINYDPNRFRGPHAEMIVGHTSTNAYCTTFPMPYSYSYQIDFWCKYRTTANQFAAWLTGQFFSHETVLYADLSKASKFYGKVLIPIQNGNGTLQADTEFDENTFRTIHYTHSITLLGWAFYDIQEAPAITTISVEYKDLSDSGTLETQAVEE